MKNYINLIKKILTISVGSAAYIFLFYHIFTKQNILNSHLISLTNINFLNVSLFLIIWLIYIGTQGWYLKKVFDRWNIPIDFVTSIEIWLASVALGLVSFGVGGIVYIFYQSKKRFNSLDSRLPSKFTFSYYAGYIGGVLLFLIFTFLFYFSSTYLKFLIVLIILLVFIFSINWRKKGFLLAFYALPSVILNLALFIFSFHILKLQLSFLQYILSYDINIILSVVSPSSGGLGFVELGLLKYLEYSRLSTGQASLATLVYRLISLWLTALLGYGALIYMGLKKPDYTQGPESK